MLQRQASHMNVGKHSTTNDTEKKMEKLTEKMVVPEAEDETRATPWKRYGPHPGLALLKFWQGVVELCIAIVVFVSV